MIGALEPSDRYNVLSLSSFMPIEVEIKARLSSFSIEDMRSILEARGARFRCEMIEEDLYLSSPLRDLSLSDEALRIRKQTCIADSKRDEKGSISTFLTYKGPKISRGSKSRKEIEVEIYEREAGMLRELLVSLGYGTTGIVEKRRLEMDLGDYLICLDRVRGLGNFMEIEKVTEDPDIIETTVASMKHLVPEIGDDDWIEDSYLELLLSRTDFIHGENVSQRKCDIDQFPV